MMRNENRYMNEGIDYDVEELEYVKFLVEIRRKVGGSNIGGGRIRTVFLEQNNLCTLQSTQGRCCNGGTHRIS